MLKPNEIFEMIKLVDGSTVDEVNYEHNGFVLRVKNQNGLAEEDENKDAFVQSSVGIKPETKIDEDQEKPQSTEKGDVKNKNYQITSPMVGTFYSSPSPDEPSFVKIGDQITEESVLGVVEAMKLFNDVKADVDGEVLEVLVENGELVEYGQPLFLVKPE